MRPTTLWTPAISGCLILPFFKVPLGSGSDSGGAKAEKGEGEARNDEAKEKERLDKKVDDAIKKVGRKNKAGSGYSRGFLATQTFGGGAVGPPAGFATQTFGGGKKKPQNSAQS